MQIDMSDISGGYPQQDHALGQAFAMAVRDAGIVYDFGDIPADLQEMYWDNVAISFMGSKWDGTNADVSAFVEALKLQPGGTVTQECSLHDNLFLHGDSYPPIGHPSWYHLRGGTTRNISVAGYTFTVTSSVKYTLGWNINNPEEVGDRHCNYMCGDGTVKIVISPQGTNNSDSIDTYNNLYYNIVKDDYFNIGAAYADFYFCFRLNPSVGTISFRYYAVYHFFTEQGQEIVETNRPRIFSNRFYIDVPQDEKKSTIRFSWPKGGGGGSGGGMSAEEYLRKTLHFTARSGAPGTFGDPTAGGFPVPTARAEVPAYGSGGYGGHGGGGGAGSATVLVRKFSTDKAAAVDQTALTRPHGYGSPGGEGGQGGDGCILIFW